MEEFFDDYAKAKQRAVELMKSEGLVSISDNPVEYEATVKPASFGLVVGYRSIIVETKVTTYTLFYV